jgi:DNA-binding transcriptional LysR family regulator
VELRHLAALQAVAAEGSFHRAAIRLGYTQSAVSQQIAMLERIVGERLINRPGGPKPVSLTEGGRLLLRHADVILARLHAAQADLAALASGLGGSLRVGTYQSVSRRILPALMRDFIRAWPQLEIHLSESTDDEDLLRLVERGELDLAFASVPMPAGPFEAVELLRDRYVLVVRADSPLAGRAEPPRLSEIEAHLRTSGVEPRIVFRSDDNGTVQALVAAGVGVALIPRLAVEPDVEHTVVVDVADAMPPRRIALVWHRDRYRSPAAHAFIEAAVALCGELQDAVAA